MPTKVYVKIINQLRETCKYKCRVAIILLILLSLVCFFIMLIGSAIRSVDLNKFTFDEPMSAILQRKSIKFTLFGYCIDDRCSNDKISQQGR